MGNGTSQEGFGMEGPGEGPHGLAPVGSAQGEPVPLGWAADAALPAGGAEWIAQDGPAPAPGAELLPPTKQLAAAPLDEAAAAAQDGPAAVSEAELRRSMEEAALDVQPWEAGRFSFVRHLQDAVRNPARVDLMLVGEGRSRQPVVVKRLPNWWIAAGPREFEERQPKAIEFPWRDLGIVRRLNALGFPHACTLLGVFRDEENTYAMTPYASGGSLFAWSSQDTPPGREREALMLPIVTQIFDGVRWLHDYGIAHRDLSLENIVLADAGHGRCEVKIIDFAMASLSQTSPGQVRGKPSYQAPEMHTGLAYDAFLADAFALGVVIFGMALRDYPWTSTKPNTSQLFDHTSRYGLLSMLERQRLRRVGGERDGPHLIDVLSPQIVELLEGLLQPQPQERWALGEPCYDAAPGRRGSAFQAAWLGGAGAAGHAAVQQNPEGPSLVPASCS